MWLSDWLKEKPVSIGHPISVLRNVFPRFLPAGRICFESWLVHWIARVLRDWPEGCLWCWLVVRPSVKSCCMIIIPCAFRYASSLFLFLRWNQTLKPLSSVFLMRQRRNWLTGRNERISCIKSSWKWWHNGRGMLFLKIYRIRKRSQICLKGLAESKFFN